MRSRIRLAIIVSALCAAAIALPTSGQSAEPSIADANVAVAGDWCPVGVYMSTTGRCCLDPDACRSQIQALPRPHILDPAATRSTTLSGAEQSETTPGDPNGSGSVTLTTKPNISQVCFTINMSGINLQAVAGHVHKAPRGQTNVVPAVDMFENVNASSTISQCRFADPQTIRELRTNPRAYYVQVHNLEYPEGAIRGQLGD
jgi:hypothetical protein